MKTILQLLCAVVALSLNSMAQADDPIIIKFSHVMAPDTPKGKAALKFKELAEIAGIVPAFSSRRC